MRRNNIYDRRCGYSKINNNVKIKIAKNSLGHVMFIWPAKSEQKPQSSGTSRVRV